MDRDLFESPGHTPQVGSRRRVLGTLSGGTLGVLGSLLIGGDAAAKKRRKKRRKKKRGKSQTPSAFQLAYECPGPSEVALLNGPTARVAQVFSATRSGRLRRIRVPVRKDAGTSGDWVLQLLKVDAGAPGHSPLDVLAAATIADAAVPEGISTLSADFAATRLEAGAEYAAVISRPGGTLRHLVHPSGSEICTGQMHLAQGSGEFSPGAVEMIVSLFVD